jgi:hypothetical protein
MDVAVVVGRALHDLAVLVSVAAGNLDQPRRLEDEVPLRPVGHEPVRRPAGDDHVVAVLVGEVTERGLERSRALVDEDHLVALAVPEEVVHARVGTAERDLDVLVPHERPATRDLVAFGLDVVRVLEPVGMRVGHPLLALDRRERTELLHPTGRDDVVQDRLVPREPLEAHHLFGEERPVLAEHDVTLARKLAATLVEGHLRLPFAR